MSRGARTRRRRRGAPGRRAPVKVTSAGPAPVLLAAVPGSVLQAIDLARKYAEEHTGQVLLVRRGEKILCRLDPDEGSANPAGRRAA